MSQAPAYQYSVTVPCICFSEQITKSKKPPINRRAMGAGRPEIGGKNFVDSKILNFFQTSPREQINHLSFSVAHNSLITTNANLW